MDSINYESKIYDEIVASVNFVNGDAEAKVLDKNSLISLLLSTMHTMERMSHGRIRGPDKKRIALAVVRKIVEAATNIDGEEKQALLYELDHTLPYLVDEAVNIANGVYKLAIDANKCCLLICNGKKKK